MRLKEGFPLKYGAVPLTQNGKEVDMEEKICSLSMRQIFSVMELIGQTYVIGLFLVSTQETFFSCLSPASVTYRETYEDRKQPTNDFGSLAPVTGRKGKTNRGDDLNQERVFNTSVK